jgi:1-deoxyxylulose-5-phosphate synthase
MKQMHRREFLERAVLSAGAAITALPALAGEGSREGFPGNEPVDLGKTGIRMSRLGMGTGTIGGKEQRDLGIQGLANLLKYAYERGIIYWDMADTYKTHPYVKEALKNVPREKIVILTKTTSRAPEAVKADLDRFLSELGTDHVDICLMHCMTDAEWTTKLKGSLDALSEAKEKKKVRAIGCSCHALPALKAAVACDQVDVVLARINHDGAKMDAPPDQVVPVLKQLKSAGKGVLGMKILGEGTLAAQRKTSLEFVLNLGCVDAFNIGFSGREQIDDIMEIMSKTPAKA